MLILDIYRIYFEIKIKQANKYSLKYCIIRFTSLHYARTFHVLEFLSEAFRCHVHHFSMQWSSIESNAHGHGIEKLLLKTQISEKFLHSEVEYNNTIYYSARSRLTKQQQYSIKLACTGSRTHVCRVEIARLFSAPQSCP